MTSLNVPADFAAEMEETESELDVRNDSMKGGSRVPLSLVVDGHSVINIEQQIYTNGGVIDDDVYESLLGNASQDISQDIDQINRGVVRRTQTKRKRKGKPKAKAAKKTKKRTRRR